MPILFLLILWKLLTEQKAETQTSEKARGKAGKIQSLCAVLGSRQRTVNQHVYIARQLAWAQLQINQCMACILPHDDIPGKQG